MNQYLVYWLFIISVFSIILNCSTFSSWRLFWTFCLQSAAKSFTSGLQSSHIKPELWGAACESVLIAMHCFFLSLSLLFVHFCVIIFFEPAVRKPGTGTAATSQRWWWAAWSAQEVRWLWASASITKPSTARKRPQSFQQESSALRVS